MVMKAKPFSMEYVLDITVKNIIASIDVSIAKTLDRIAEFDGNSDKSTEVLKTLSALRSLRSNFDITDESKV